MEESGKLKSEWVVSFAGISNVHEREFWNDRENYQETDKMIFANFGLGPTELIKLQKEPGEHTYAELRTLIERVKRNGANAAKWLVDLYLKIAFPFSSFVLALFGATIASGRERSTGTVGITITLGICYFYFAFVKLGQTLGHVGLVNPTLSAWLSNIIFLSFGIIILLKTPK